MKFRPLFRLSAGLAFGAISALAQLAPPSISQSVSPVAIPLNGTSNLSIAIANPNSPTVLGSTFIATTNMTTARSIHTATLLGNGKVLITGGVGTSDNSLSSAELYDLATGAFTATGSMTKVRDTHTATLLGNGKVLIAGGENFTVGPVASAELYDPATGLFTATGDMAAARESHTATLLSNGKVLIAGGQGSSGPIAGAELFDPATGTFTATGSMAIAHSGQTATLLSNGKVLIAGGSLASSTAELYDPAAGTFAATGSMTASRIIHTATVLSNGRVLIAGGVSTGGAFLASAELYDPAAGTFAATGSMATARDFHTAIRLSNGKVLIAGGWAGGTIFASAEVYDPAAGTFAATGSMTTPRLGHTATVLGNGTVLLAGGGTNTSPIATNAAEIYGSSALVGIGVTDTLPTGISVISNTAAACGGTLMTTAPSSIKLAGAFVVPSGSCNFNVTVTGAVAGNYTITSGAVTSSNGGTGNTSTVGLSVVTPPTITAQFGASSIPLNGTTSLSLSITNPNASSSLTNVAFTDALPSGLVVAIPNVLTGSCGGGTITATTGSNLVSLTGATLTAGASCNFSVNLQGITSGVKFNNVTASSTESGPGLTASAVITVAAPAGITKSFGVSSITLNGMTSLSFSITNPNAGSSLTNVSFTDSFPAGLVVATPNGLTGSCGGGTITAVPGSSSVSFAGATLTASASCNFSVNVQGTAAGVKNNSVTVSSTEGGTGNISTASVNVAAPPGITKSFGVSSLPLNGTTSLSFSIANPKTGSSQTNVSFTDSFPAGLAVATPNGLTGSCGGGTITAAPGSSLVSLVGATLTAGASCTFSVNVQGTALGMKNNSVTVSSTEGGTGNTSTASVNVINTTAPSITKSFGVSSITLNGMTSLSFSIANPNAGSSLTNVSFTDSFPSGLVVATPNGLTGSCGGATIVAASGSSLVSLAGATLAASASCTFSVNVQGTALGMKNNSVMVSSTESGTGNTSNASVNVINANGPSITKSFGAPSIMLNGTTSLSFSITNPNAGSSLTNVSFTDPFPAGLAVATPNGLTGTCGGGTIVAASGSSSVSLTGATLAASASCTFSVNIQGTAFGMKNNSVAVSATESGMGNTSTASVNVINTTAPSITKSFGASSITLNATTSLSFNIANPNAGSSLTNVSFTDPFPSGLVVATPNGLTGSCGGGTITAAPGSSSVSLAGATLAASASCTFSVNVQGTAFGMKNNSVMVSAMEGGTGNTSTASVNVINTTAPSITKSFGVSSLPLNGVTSLSFSIINPDAGSSLTNVSFTDSFPSGLVVATPNGLTGSCGGGTITAAPGSSSVSLAGATLTASASCSFSVNVQGATGGVKNNSVTVSATESGPGNSSTATLSVLVPPPTITAYSPTSVQAASADFTLTLTGTNFCGGSQLMWNSASLPTTYFSSTSLTAVVPGSLLTTPATATIRVVNPAGSCSSGGTSPGGTSPAVSFVVAALSAPQNSAVSVQPTLIQLVALAGSTTKGMNSVSVRNVSGTPLSTPIATNSFTVSGGDWLVTIPQTAEDLQNGVIRFTADPTGLATGSYLGYVLYPGLNGTSGSAGSRLTPRDGPSCTQFSTAVKFTVGSPLLTISPLNPMLTLGETIANTIDVTVNAISQAGSQTIPMLVAATSADGAGAPCWLSIAPLDKPLQTGTAFQATASSANLQPGIHVGGLTVQAAQQTASDVITFTNASPGSPVVDAGMNLMTIDSKSGVGMIHVGTTPAALPFTATCNGCTGATLTGACNGCTSANPTQVSGMTPADLTVTIDPMNATLFNPGQASIGVSTAGATPLIIPVTKGRDASTTGPQIFSGGVVSAGLSAPSLQVASPNAILSIFGQNFAPAGTSRAVSSGDLVNGFVPTNLDGVCVLFGDQRAPIFLVTPGQLNVQAPQLPMSGSVPVQVLTNCDTGNQAVSATVTIPVQQAAPEFFYAASNASGKNPVAAKDGVTLAGVGDPSRLGAGFALGYPGEVVTIYATGLGLSAPAYAPGQLPPAATQVQGVTAAIDGATVNPSAILYAGVSPLLAGVYQLNLQLPAGLAAGDHTITISVNGVSSPLGPYISTGPLPK